MFCVFHFECFYFCAKNTKKLLEYNLETGRMYFGMLLNIDSLAYFNFIIFVLNTKQNKMKSNLIILFLSCCILACSNIDRSTNGNDARTAKQYPTTGSIEALDESFSEIIASDAAIEILAEGFTWSEGPVWIDSLNSVLFSDVPENRIWRWSEADSLQLYLEPSGYLDEVEISEPGSNGLILDNNGRLILCQHGERQVAYMDAPLNAPKSKFVALAQQYEGKRFNSPNDLVIDRQGNIYFTDPPYGLPQQMNDPQKEIPFQGVYRRNLDGSIDLLVDSLTRPNGVELTPDEKTLYVAVSDPERAYWMAYDLQSDGQLNNARIFHDTTPDVGKAGRKGVPDGMVVHSNGIVFGTGPGGVWVLSKDGKLLGKILTGQATANCTLNAREEYLYMTADMYLMRVKLKNE